MDSARGEPLRAFIAVHTSPGEQMRPECLSLGDGRYAPDAELSVLPDAKVTLTASGKAIAVSTTASVDLPSVSVVLRVQCPQGPVYARLVTFLLKPTGAPAVTIEVQVPGTTITVKPGDSVYRLSRTIFPDNETAVRNLAQAIVLANPGLFPDRRARPLKVGEMLVIPELRSVPRILAEHAEAPLPAGSAAARIAPPQRAPSATPSVQTGRRKDRAAPQPHREARPVAMPAILRLKLAVDIDLRRSEGIDATRRAELRRSLQGEPTVGGPGAEVPDAERIELRVAQLRESQAGIDEHLRRLEDAVATLRKTIAERATTAPTPRPAAPPPPAPVHVATARSEVPWWIWAAVAMAGVIASVAAFLFGRKVQSRDVMADHEARIDALLDEARAAAGPLLGSVPELPTAKPPDTKAGTLATRLGPPPAGRHELADTSRERAGPVQSGTPTAIAAGEAPPSSSAATSGAAMQPRGSADVTTNLRREMDIALDNARSMFTDVDRFIALGRIQNAISLLEFQIKKNPGDRDSWVKLMAVYRQEGMDSDFERTHSAFRQQFSGEK